MLQEMKQEVGRIDWTQAGAKLERLIRLCENGQANDPEAVALVKDVYEMQYALERVHADASRMQEQEAKRFEQHFGKERKSPVKVCVRKLYGKPETVTLYK